MPHPYVSVVKRAIRARDDRMRSLRTPRIEILRGILGPWRGSASSTSVFVLSSVALSVNIGTTGTVLGPAAEISAIGIYGCVGSPPSDPISVSILLSSPWSHQVSAQVLLSKNKCHLLTSVGTGTAWVIPNNMASLRSIISSRPMKSINVTIIPKMNGPL